MKIPFPVVVFRNVIYSSDSWAFMVQIGAFGYDGKPISEENSGPMVVFCLSLYVVVLLIKYQLIIYLATLFLHFICWDRLRLGESVDLMLYFVS